MSYEHRLLMRRRLELYHDLLTEQLRPRIEAAAAVTAEATTEATTDNPESDDTDRNIEDDTDDSDEDLCEWEHTENKSSEESCARVTEWRCGVERNGIWEDDTPDHRKNPDKGPVRGEMEQHDDDETSPSTEVSDIEHFGGDSNADRSGKSHRRYSAPIWGALAANTINKPGELEEAADGDNTPSRSETAKREGYITVLLDQTAPVSESSADEAPEGLTTPPSSPCRASSVTTSPVTINEPSHQTSLLGKTTVIDYSQLISAETLQRSKSVPPRNLFLSRCPPTPPPDTTSFASCSSQLRFTVTPAELKFFNRHIEEVAYMIRGIDYQFQMQEYRQEMRRQSRRRKRRAEVKEQLELIEWDNGVVPEEWNNTGGKGEAEMVEEAADEIGHRSWNTSGQWTSGGLQEVESIDKNWEGVDNPGSSEPVEIEEGCGTYGYEDDLDSVWPEDVGEDDNMKEEWDFAWSSKLMEVKENIHLHQPTKPSPLRKGYTPDDMVWEEAVEEAEYLSFYGHQPKKDKRGRRYWRL